MPNVSRSQSMFEGSGRGYAVPIRRLSAHELRLRDLATDELWNDPLVYFRAPGDLSTSIKSLYSDPADDPIFRKIEYSPIESRPSRRPPVKERPVSYYEAASPHTHVKHTPEKVPYHAFETPTPPQYRAPKLKSHSFAEGRLTAKVPVHHLSAHELGLRELATDELWNDPILYLGWGLNPNPLDLPDFRDPDDLSPSIRSVYSDGAVNDPMFKKVVMPRPKIAAHLPRRVKVKPLSFYEAASPLTPVRLRPRKVPYYQFETPSPRSPPLRRRPQSPTPELDSSFRVLRPLITTPTAPQTEPIPISPEQFFFSPKRIPTPKRVPISLPPVPVRPGMMQVRQPRIKPEDLSPLSISLPPSPPKPRGIPKRIPGVLPAKIPAGTQSPRIPVRIQERRGPQKVPGTVQRKIPAHVPGRVAERLAKRQARMLALKALEREASSEPRRKPARGRGKVIQQRQSLPLESEILPSQTPPSLSPHVSPTSIEISPSSGGRSYEAELNPPFSYISPEAPVSDSSPMRSFLLARPPQARVRPRRLRTPMIQPDLKFRPPRQSRKHRRIRPSSADESLPFSIDSFPSYLGTRDISADPQSVHSDTIYSDISYSPSITEPQVGSPNVTGSTEESYDLDAALKNYSEFPSRRALIETIRDPPTTGLITVPRFPLTHEEAQRGMFYGYRFRL